MGLISNYKLCIIFSRDLMQKMDIEKTNNPDNQNIPWVEKYRPSALQDLISHQGILTTLSTFIKDNNLPNLLFYGPPGTGKTSTIVALAKQLYGSDYKKMVLELNASDERGINVVRDSIKSFAGSMSLSKNLNAKLIILDEADMMTNPAQYALRRIIQKYSSNARFCLISNYVSKIIPALQSRCTRFKFKQIPLADASQRIIQICQLEKLNITQQGIDAVFALCQGDMRRVVNMLQSLSMTNFGGQITQKIVYQFTGNPSPKQIQQYMSIILNNDLSTAYKIINNELKERGISLQTIVRQFYQILLTLKFTQDQKAVLVKRLGDIEYRTSIGCQENISLASLIGAFNQIKHTSSNLSI